MKNRYGNLIKSDRAIEAENSGMKTYSKLKAWQKRAVDAGDVYPCEWHHTSAAANKTYYYDMDDFMALNPEDYPVEKSEKVAQADFNRIKIKITYDKMVGGFTSRFKEFVEATVVGLDVRKKDNVIVGAGGRRLTSNNNKIEIFYRPYRCKKFRTITYEEAEAIGYTFSTYF